MKHNQKDETFYRLSPVRQLLVGIVVIGLSAIFAYFMANITDFIPANSLPNLGFIWLLVDLVVGILIASFAVFIFDKDFGFKKSSTLIITMTILSIVASPLLFILFALLS